MPDPSTDAGPPLRLSDGRVRALGRPFRQDIAALVALRMVSSGARIGQAVALAAGLDHVIRSQGNIAAPSAAIGGLAVVRLVADALAARRRSTAGLHVRTQLRGRVLDRLFSLGPGYLLRHRTGALDATVVDAVDALGDYYACFVPLALTTAATTGGVIAVITILDPLAGLVLSACALLVPLAPVLTARAFGASARAFATGIAAATSDYLDAIQGLLTLKAFGADERWRRRLNARGAELSADATALAGLTNMHVAFVALGLGAGSVLAVAVAATQASHHALGGTAVIAILLLSREAFAPLADLQATFPAAYDAVARAHGVLEVLDAVPLPAARPAPHAMAPARTPVVSFDHVTFAYQPGRRPALDAVSFTAGAGETVAIIGPSGAGKSTVVGLLLRFFDADDGAIRVLGTDVRDLDREAIRRLVSATFQEPYLFDRTIRENLLLGRPDASDADLAAALCAARADDVVTALPDGWDTVAGERGGHLSGGERQRLTIARALLTRTPILVLDEPTSSVDGASEALITDAIDGATHDRTTLVIAHRLSTIQRADRVVVLDRGRVVESGPFADLSRAGGRLASMLASQELLG